MHDLSEYRDKVKEKKRGQQEAQKTHYYAIIQAAVSAEYLTNDENWNKYLSYLQSIIEQTEASIEEIEHSLWSPDLVNNERIMYLKMTRLRFQERINALKLAMEVPKQIMDGSEDAKKRLEELAKL